MDVLTGASEMTIAEEGPLRAALQAQTKWRDTVVVQTIRLAAMSRRIGFVSEVDWHEEHTLLTAAFPVPVTAGTAEFDFRCGAVDRSTKRESSFDAARFEVPAQKWARLYDGELSVAVLND